MAWSTPPSWATTSGISVGSLNTFMRDNLLSLRNNNDWLIQATKSANQSIGATVYTAITYNVHQITIGTTALHSTASGSKWMAPVAGYYRLIGTQVWASASGWLTASYRLNGSTLNYDMNSDMSENVINREIFFADTIAMTTADYLEVMGRVERNTSGTIISGSTATRATWHLIGAAS